MIDAPLAATLQPIRGSSRREQEDSAVCMLRPDIMQLY